MVIRSMQWYLAILRPFQGWLSSVAHSVSSGWSRIVKTLPAVNGTIDSSLFRLKCRALNRSENPPICQSVGGTNWRSFFSPLPASNRKMLRFSAGPDLEKQNGWSNSAPLNSTNPCANPRLVLRFNPSRRPHPEDDKEPFACLQQSTWSPRSGKSGYLSSRAGLCRTLNLDLRQDFRRNLLACERERSGARTKRSGRAS